MSTASKRSATPLVVEGLSVIQEPCITVTLPIFDEGHHETSVTGSTGEITVGSWTFQPLIQSQRVKSTSPKAVMKVKSKLVFGRMYGPKPPIIQPPPAMNNTIPNIHGMYPDR